MAFSSMPVTGSVSGTFLKCSRTPARWHSCSKICAMCRAWPRGSCRARARAPTHAAIAQTADQRLEAWTVVVLAALDGVGEFLDDDEGLGDGELLQRAALGVDRDVAAVLAGSQVQGGAVCHFGEGGGLQGGVPETSRTGGSWSSFTSSAASPRRSPRAGVPDVVTLIGASLRRLAVFIFGRRSLRATRAAPSTLRG
jgi:hypothetical protein